MAGLTGRKLIASRCAKFFKDGDFVNASVPNLVHFFAISIVSRYASLISIFLPETTDFIVNIDQLSEYSRMLYMAF